MANWNMPVERWTSLMAEHYPGGGWVRLDRATLDRLNRRRGELHLPRWTPPSADLLGEEGS